MSEHRTRPELMTLAHAIAEELNAIDEPIPWAAPLPVLPALRPVQG